jgi:hypothetical protein
MSQEPDLTNDYSQFSDLTEYSQSDYSQPDYSQADSILRKRPYDYDDDGSYFTAKTSKSNSSYVTAIEVLPDDDTIYPEIESTIKDKEDRFMFSFASVKRFPFLTIPVKYLYKKYANKLDTTTVSLEDWIVSNINPNRHDKNVKCTSKEWIISNMFDSLDNLISLTKESYLYASNFQICVLVKWNGTNYEWKILPPQFLEQFLLIKEIGYKLVIELLSNMKRIGTLEKYKTSRSWFFISCDSPTNTPKTSYSAHQDSVPMDLAQGIQLYARKAQETQVITTERAVSTEVVLHDVTVNTGKSEENIKRVSKFNNPWDSMIADNLKYQHETPFANTRSGDSTTTYGSRQRDRDKFLRAAAERNDIRDLKRILTGFCESTEYIDSIKAIHGILISEFDLHVELIERLNFQDFFNKYNGPVTFTRQGGGKFNKKSRRAVWEKI